MPLVEVAGRVGTEPFAQMVNVFPKLNVGGMFGFTVTVYVAVVAQSPVVGVKV